MKLSIDIHADKCNYCNAHACCSAGGKSICGNPRHRAQAIAEWKLTAAGRKSLAARRRIGKATI